MRVRCRDDLAIAVWGEVGGVPAGMDGRAYFEVACEADVRLQLVSEWARGRVRGDRQDWRGGRLGCVMLARGQRLNKGALHWDGLETHGVAVQRGRASARAAMR